MFDSNTWKDSPFAFDVNRYFCRFDCRSVNFITASAHIEKKYESGIFFTTFPMLGIEIKKCFHFHFWVKLPILKISSLFIARIRVKLILSANLYKFTRTSVHNYVCSLYFSYLIISATVAEILPGTLRTSTSKWSEFSVGESLKEIFQIIRYI